MLVLVLVLVLVLAVAWVGPPKALSSMVVWRGWLCRVPLAPLALPFLAPPHRLWPLLSSGSASDVA